MGLFRPRRPGWLLEAVRKNGPRGMAAHRRPRLLGWRGQNPAYRPSGISLRG